MDECVFCAILEGRAAASLVHEDPSAVAFLDLFPVHRGHMLVVPRKHIPDLTSCPRDLAGHLFGVASTLARHVVDVVEADGFNVWTANGRAAGQDVFHLHLHVLPRFRGDRLAFRFPKSYPREALREELDTMAARIKARCSANR